MAAFLILRICRKNQTRCAIVLLGAGIPITTSLYSVNGYKIMEQKQDISKDVRYYVDLLTEEQEPVYLVNLTGEYSYDDLKRRPAANLIYVHPWFMKVYEKQLVKQLEENSPRLITYTDDFYIWGYNVTEYTSFLRNFIIQNYCRIGEENANIWVRNDYYDEAEAILSSQEIQIYPKSEKYDGNWVLMHGVSIEQSFIADVDFISKMSLNFETFSRFNTGLITIDIKAVETGDIIYSKMICQEDIIQGWNDISFGQNLELNKGERYDIILKAFDTTKDSSVALFVNILLNDNTEALLEGGKSDYLYGIRLFQAIE